MKTLLLSTSTAAIAFISSPALAASKIVSINDLTITSGRFTVQVPAGDGIVLDLSEVGQIVKGAVFGDATKFVISGIDGQLCYMQKDKCEATGAGVVSLRQVNGIEIATQSHSLDGSTTITLTTDGKLGPKVLHMLLIPAIKAPYTAIVARKDLAPVQPAVASRIESPQLKPHKVNISELPNDDANTTSSLLPLGTTDAARALSKPIGTDEHGENGKPSSLTVASTLPAPLLPTTYEPSPEPLLPMASQQPALASVEHQPLFQDNNIQPYQTEVNTVVLTSHPTDSQKALPSAPQKTSISDSPEINSRPTSTTPNDSLSFSLSESNSVNDGYSVALGLLVAKKIGWIKPQTIIWNKAQKAVAGLLQGETKTDALHHSRLETQDFEQLLAWGKVAINLWRQGENFASIIDIIQANALHDAERASLLKQLVDWKASNS